MERGAGIYVAGHTGLAGSAILRRLQSAGYRNVIVRTRRELDLTRQDAVADFFRTVRPDYVFLAAARVGGILANAARPAEFIRINLAIQTHVIHAAYETGVKKLLFLGSSCIYPRDCPQPMREDDLLTGPLEPTNSAYAVAKIAGIEMCRAYNRQYGTAFIPVMPANLYGPGDHFNLETSHVLPAMIRKFHLARMADRRDLPAIQRDIRVFGAIPKGVADALGLSPDSSEITGRPVVRLWGTGSARREFLHVDDLAAACLHVMTDDRVVRTAAEGPLLLNIGAGKDCTIRDLADIIAGVAGYRGEVSWDASLPDGTPRKLLDISRLTDLGWRAGVGLTEGVRRTYEWYLSRVA